jgi:1,4-alpha-glucan branching enzyme
MFAQPGKKMLFMGAEIGTWDEWNHDAALDWGVLERPAHAGLRNWVAELNRVYRGERALHQGDCTQAGFEWLDCCDAEQSAISWVRKGTSTGDLLAFVCNFTPMVRRNYRIGVPAGGHWRELLNSDAVQFGGSGQGNFGGVDANPFESHGRAHSLLLTLPPLAMVCLKRDANA